jgi:putative zinc finger/helix-turn-helix YgiT family protein
MEGEANQMTCFVCGEGTLEKRTALVEGEVRHKKYMVDTPALVCDACGHAALEGRDTQEFMRRVADAYRRACKPALLTSSEIRRIRGTLSQQRFADELSVGVASVKRWELGLIQDRRNDKLIREFQKNLGARYVYEDVASPVEVYADGPESRAHGPPAHQEVHTFVPRHF